MRGLAALLAALLVASCARAPSDRIGVSVPYQIDTLDPHVKNTLSNFSIVSHFYEPLVTTTAEMTTKPCLARLWENPDPSTWVFHLQPGVTFHSGKRFGAEDVVYTIKRLATAERLEMTGYVLYISDVAAVDPLSVRIRTSKPLSVLLNKLRFVPIVPEGARPEALASAPDGTGPYTLAEWTKGQAIRMVRNDRYWGPKPALREVVFHLDRAPDAAAEDLVSGRSRLIQCNSRRAEAVVRDARRFDLLRRTSLFVKYLGCDLAHEVSPYASVRPNPFRSRLVRQALHVAVDRKRLVDGLPSHAVPAGQFVPPTIFGFNPEIQTPGHDPGKARVLLRDAGLPDGFAATLHVRKIFSEAAQLVRDQLTEVGIRLQVKPLDDPEFLEAARRGDYALHLSRFGCPTGDASDILDTALHTADPARHMGMNNYGGYSNPQVDRAIEESAGIEGLQDRRAALERIMALAMEDLPWVPLYVDQDVYAIDRTLSWQPRNDSFVLAQEISPRR